MDEHYKHYQKQAGENMKAFSQNGSLYGAMVIDPQLEEMDSSGQLLTNTLLLMLHYAVALPVFMLCWYLLVHCLRRRGHIDQQGAEQMMNELRGVRIARSPAPRLSFSPLSALPTSNQPI